MQANLGRSLQGDLTYIPVIRVGRLKPDSAIAKATGTELTSYNFFCLVNLCSCLKVFRVYMCRIHDLLPVYTYASYCVLKYRLPSVVDSIFFVTEHGLRGTITSQPDQHGMLRRKLCQPRHSTLNRRDSSKSRGLPCFQSSSTRWYLCLPVGIRKMETPWGLVCRGLANSV